MGKKIIFVNSFKGGTGKTTLSMAHCIDNLFNRHGYENVIYLDLDVLGTATSYLFEDGKLPEEESFDKTSKTKEIELKFGRASETLYVGYLSAAMKKNSNYGEPYFLHHQKVLEEIFIKQITDFIDTQVKAGVSSLIVIDCAPGFGEIEQKVLTHCYKEKYAQIEEEYLVTLDSAHVKKCIKCLIEHKEAADIDITKRNISIIVNDVQDYCDFLLDQGFDDMEEMDKIMQNMYDEMSVGLSGASMAFRLWRYSRDIAVKSVYTRSTNLENHVDDYLFTGDNFKEWKAGRGFV